MNTHEVSLRIANPSLLVSSDIPTLHELCRKFPYSSVFSILYLKALALDKVLDLEEEVSKHSYKISDRSKLYELLNQQDDEEIVKEIFEVTKEEVTRDEGNSDEGKVENLTGDVREREIDLDVISHAVSGVFHQEFEPKADEGRKSRVKSQESRVESSKSKVESLAMEVESQESRVKSQELGVDSSQLVKDSRQAFTSWLKAGDSIRKPDKTSKTETIINTFIEEDPTISKPKKEFYSPIKQAKQSIDSGNIVYTETLAAIMVIQGNYQTAISAYEQLCLTIPEKKTFFVEKIKELKEKLNS
jgi:hypothetical protein